MKKIKSPFVKKRVLTLPVSVQRGASLNGAANALVCGITPEFETTDNQKDSTFGVDSHEITEHHLQAALSSNQVETTSTGGSAPKKAYHIPTPKTVEALTQAQYDKEYPPNAYSDPVTYVRFSDTVEGCISGAPYCLDEDDKGWLDKHNNKVKEALESALKDKKNDADKQVLIQKDPAKYKAISEDEFETVMYVFERTTNERHPLLELDISKLPPLSDLLPEFESNSASSKLALPELPESPMEIPVNGADVDAGNKASSKVQSKSQDQAQSNLTWSASNPFRNLSVLKPCAYAVYPWWKLRRQAREGKGIVPLLNFDESNDNDPYVCFRRREVKSARKTRKTDNLQLEKLVRLESELKQATTLFLMIAQRERIKNQQITKARACWKQAQELLALKRQWNIQGPNKGQDDESLIFGIQPDPNAPVPTAGASQNAQLFKKKRKAEESSASTTLKIRRPKNNESDSATTAKVGGEGVATAAGSAIMERIQAVQAYIERECHARQLADAGVEDLTDSAFQPMVAPPSLRAFRPIQSDNNDTHFWSNHPFARLGRQSCFRRRIGRGGRVLLDRRPVVVSPSPANIGAWPRQRQNGFPLATFGYMRPTESAKRQDGATRSAGNDPLRSYAPFAYSARVAPMLLPTPDLSWDPLTSKDPRASLTHDPHFYFGSQDDDVKEAPAYSVGPQAEVASTDSDSTDRSHTTVESGDGQSTQATDPEQEPMQEDKVQNGIWQTEEESVEEQMERAQRLAERWRYDEDGGRFAGMGLLGLGGMEGDEEAILDDYDQRFIRYRMSLLDESSLLKLSTDWTYMRQALLATATRQPVPVHATTLASADTVKSVGAGSSARTSNTNKESSTQNTTQSSSEVTPPVNTK